MDLDTLERIAEHYRVFKKVFREARKSFTDESLDKLHESSSLIEDLFIVEIFSCFERFLRNKILAGIKLEESPPVSRVDFDKAYELIFDVMVQVDRESE